METRQRGQATWTWDSHRTKSLIVEYEKYVSLYNSQHELYRNKKTREETLARMASALNVAWRSTGITCTVEDIKKKLNGLRSQYLFERAKITRSEQRGEVYTPTIYWYPMLKFLEPYTFNGPPKTSYLDFVATQMPASDDSSNEPTMTTVKAEDDCSASTSSAEHSFIDLPSFLQKEIQITVKRKTDDDPLYIPESAGGNQSTMPVGTHRKKRARLSLEEVSEHLETFGRFVANELRAICVSSGEVVMRQTKRQLQQVLIDAWARIDMDDSHFLRAPYEN